MGNDVDKINRGVLPIPTRPRTGLVTFDAKDPDTKYPPIEQLRPPKGAPNVLVILLDDAGFGSSSAFGGPCQTPNAERLAAGGLKYNRFHTTALCSPTRQAMLTGRNHHTVGMGGITEIATGSPGYCSVLPNTAAPLAKTLKLNGYATAQFGKCHEVPVWETSPAGPFDAWPTGGGGFEYFYGFIGGEAHQWYPSLYEGTTPIEVKKTPEEGYHLMADMTDKAIGWIGQQKALQPDRPFFIYFAPGATHAPHHVPEEWADKYKGKFDQGWDTLREETFARQKERGVIPADTKLTARDEAFPAWDEVPDKLKAFYARQMEVYAGFSENADHNVGRVIDAIEELGELDNTLIVWIWGDNGASMEGTVTGSFNELTMQNGIPLTDEMQLQLSERYGGLDQWGAAIMDPHYSAAWAWAGNTPFQLGKQVGSHLGGTRNPMVVHWPAHITAGGALRTQFTHMIDVAPTILELAGIPAPDTVDGIEQEPLHGSSFAASLTDGNAPEHRTQQYFETIGNRGMYKDGWWLAMKTDRIPWVLTPDALKPYAPGVWDPDAGPAELYYLPDDFSQAKNLAAQHPEKVQELKDLFWAEAEKYKVLPLLATLSTFFGMVPPIPKQTKFEFRGDVQNVLSGMIPRIYNRSYSITADLVVPDGGAEGVIVAEADHLGGFTLYVKDGKLTHTYSMMGVFIFQQVAEERLPSGEVSVRMEFAADAPKPATGGDVTLYVNDRQVGKGRMDHTVPIRFSGYAGMDIGRDNGAVADRAYEDKKPFAFTGTVKKVVFDIAPHAAAQDELDVHTAEQHGQAAHALSE